MLSVLDDLMVKQIVPSSPIKQWSQLLSSGDFKNKLVSFLVQQWEEEKEFLGDKTLLVTSGVDTFKLTANSCSPVQELVSNQEAGPRMPLHAKHASSDYTDIVIATPDTDVFIIALAKQAEMDARLFILKSAALLIYMPSEKMYSSNSTEQTAQRTSF